MIKYLCTSHAGPATAMLAAATTHLGYTVTRGVPEHFRADYVNCVLDGRATFAMLGSCDVLIESAVTFFVELDHAFPHLKFIHVETDENIWVAAMLARSRISPVGQIARESGQIAPGLVGRLCGFGLLGQRDPEILLHYFREHNARVRRYFADRPEKLLVTDLVKDDWAPLCHFVGKPIPATKLRDLPV